MTATTKKKPALLADIEDLHRSVVERGEEHYEDPATGYLVFTELVHRKRGYCCGNACRHCPYDWENVGKKKNRNLVGGDKEDEEEDGGKNSNGSAVEEENDKNTFLKASPSVDARMDDPLAEDVTDSKYNNGGLPVLWMGQQEPHHHSTRIRFPYHYQPMIVPHTRLLSSFVLAGERLGKADYGLIPSFIRKLPPRASVLCVGAASLAIMLGTFRFYRTRS